MRKLNLTAFTIGIAFFSGAFYLLTEGEINQGPLFLIIVGMFFSVYALQGKSTKTILRTDIRHVYPGASWLFYGIAIIGLVLLIIFLLIMKALGKIS